MANSNRGRNRRTPPQVRITAVPTATSAKTPLSEPVMRRWPHPTNDSAAVCPQNSVASLHYICCTLSYQNQLLADIKALLERLTLDETAAESAEK